MKIRYKREQLTVLFGCLNCRNHIDFAMLKYQSNYFLAFRILPNGIYEKASDELASEFPHLSSNSVPEL